MRIKNYIPNTITCLNLVSGCVASVMALEGNLMYAVVWIMLAAVFDFFDGFAARLLKAFSPIGKELDSLADVVSFGVAPGMILFVLLSYSTSMSVRQPLLSVCRCRHTRCSGRRWVIRSSRYCRREAFGCL